MGRWRWVLLVGVVIVAGAAAALLLDTPVADRLEGEAAPDFSVPAVVPEWTTTTVGDSSPTGPDPSVTSLPVVATGAVLDDELAEAFIYVDPVTGSDDNSGETEADPFSTVGRALEAASVLRDDGKQVKVTLAPGSYRETVELIQDPDDSPLLVIEAAEPGATVVSGADLWTDWEWSEDDGAFVHSWPYGWGSAPDVEEIVGRREIVVIGGERLQQVLSARDLSAGSFFVDDASDRLLVVPPDGSSFSGLAAEVAVRERTLNLDSARNVVIRGITFQHAANPFESSGVRISNSRHVLFEHNRVVENSWTGLGLSTSESLTVRENVVNENGGGGVGMFQVHDVVFEGNDTSLNNWRGVQGDYVGWSIGGIKAVGVQQVAFIRHRAWWNSTRGLWLDYDVRDITIEDSSWCHNLTDGLFVEATPGPVWVAGVEACENGRYGLLLVNVYGATISDSVVCGNGDAQIHMNAERGGREIVSGDDVVVMSAARDLTLERNLIAGDGLLLDVGIPQPDFLELLTTLTAGSNQWHSSGEADAAFDFPGGGGSLADWQSASGVDDDSTAEQITDVACESVTP